VSVASGPVGHQEQLLCPRRQKDGHGVGEGLRRQQRLTAKNQGTVPTVSELGPSPSFVPGQKESRGVLGTFQAYQCTTCVLALNLALREARQGSVVDFLGQTFDAGVYVGVVVERPTPRCPATTAGPRGPGG